MCNRIHGNFLMELDGRKIVGSPAGQFPGAALDNLLVLLVIGIAGAAAICIPLLGLAIMRHSDRIALDHYGKYRGRAPAKSFVCPDCLARSRAR